VLLVATGFEVVGITGITISAFRSDLGHAGLWVITFLVSFPLVAASWVLFRVGLNRSGTLHQNALAMGRGAELLSAVVISSLGPVISIGGVLYLAAFVLQGRGRLPFALAAMILGVAITEYGATKMHQIIGRQRPHFLILSPKRRWVIAFLLAEGALVFIGLFWPELMPMS
jgi:hypothetical protein